MAKDPAFLFYPGDYLRDTQILSENTQVAYDRIMCEHMRSICISQKQLNFLTKRLSEDEKQELSMVLTKVEDGFQITWVAESILKRMAYSKSRRENRKGKKKKDVNNTSITYDPHMENENVIEDINEIKKRLIKDKDWLNAICISVKREKSLVLDKLTEFTNQNLANKKDMRTEEDFLSHFQAWLRKIPYAPKTDRERILKEQEEQLKRFEGNE